MGGERRSPRRTPWTPRALLGCFLGVLGVLGGGRVASGQEPSVPQTVSQESLHAAIDNLGKLDYQTRTDASRTIRRTAASQAVPALLTAIASHEDGYVRFRALVLLTGFNDPRTDGVMREAMTSANDRLRTVAYAYFEHHPNPAMAPELLAALDKEDAEFVRPALVRALAALGRDPGVAATLVREARRGEDFFRSAVIEALGDYQASYAVDTLIAIAGEDGPLVDDAVVALGKIGDPRAFPRLAELQRTGASSLQPLVSASLCLLGTDCEQHEQYLGETLKSPAVSQDVVRSAASALGVLAIKGRPSAARTLIDIGADARDPLRSPIALAVATVALRNTPVIFGLLEDTPSKGAISLIADGFDMLEEDLEKERFFALARRTYWGAPDDSATRVLMQTLIGTLDF